MLRMDILTLCLFEHILHRLTYKFPCAKWKQGQNSYQLWSKIEDERVVFQSSVK